MGMALRGYYRSDRHDDPFIESHLDIRDAEGNVVPGLRLDLPHGRRPGQRRGRPPLHRPRWKGVNTSHLMDAFVDFAPASWGLRPETSLGPPTGGKLPMGLSVGPRAGGNVLIAGDASGAINPFNGEGIAYGYETGRLAAAALGHALTGEGAQALTDYDRELTAAYGPYYKVARAFVHLISHPEAMRLCVGLGMRSELLMTQLLRIMANLMRPDAVGPAEVGYRAMELVSRLLPDSEGLEHRPPDPARCGAPLGRDQANSRTAPPATCRNQPASSPSKPSARRAAATTRTQASRASSSRPRRPAPYRRTAGMKRPTGPVVRRPRRTKVRARSAADGPAATVSQSMTTQPSGPTSTL